MQIHGKKMFGMESKKSKPYIQFKYCYPNSRWTKYRETKKRTPVWTFWATRDRKSDFFEFFIKNKHNIYNIKISEKYLLFAYRNEGFQYINENFDYELRIPATKSNFNEFTKIIKNHYT